MNTLLEWFGSLFSGNESVSPEPRVDPRDVHVRLPRHHASLPAHLVRCPPDAPVPRQWDNATKDPAIDMDGQEQRHRLIKRLLLSKGLPPELVMYIFTLACDGLEVSVERQFDAIYTNNANTRYLRTPPLESTFMHGFLLEVIIDIYSRDQGWSTDPHRDWIGTYEGSHTWWELSLDRPDQHSSFSDSSDSDTPDCTYTEVHRVELCRNLHATSQFKLHTITLTQTDSILRDARPGDVLSLWARSQYPGWANFASYARIRARLSWTT